MGYIYFSGRCADAVRHMIPLMAHSPAAHHSNENVTEVMEWSHCLADLFYPLAIVPSHLRGTYLYSYAIRHGPW